jgi:hypothetical protein
MSNRPQSGSAHSNREIHGPHAYVTIGSESFDERRFDKSTTVEQLIRKRAVPAHRRPECVRTKSATVHIVADNQIGARSRCLERRQSDRKTSSCADAAGLGRTVSDCVCWPPLLESKVRICVSPQSNQPHNVTRDQTQPAAEQISVIVDQTEDDVACVAFVVGGAAAVVVDDCAA